MKRVAVILVRKGKDRVLLGLREDSQRWTLPCGHADEGEEMVQAAVRELFEETGIRVKAEDLKAFPYVDKTTNSKGEPIEVYGFELEVKTEIKGTSENDPDSEVTEWTWKSAYSDSFEMHSKGMAAFMYEGLPDPS